MCLKQLHIIFLINACLLLPSCSSDDPTEDDFGAGNEMTFAVSDMSRASVTTNLNYQLSQFVVYGDMKFPDKAPNTIFDNTIVRYDLDKWLYDGTQYWFPRYEYSFVAIHPADMSSLSYSNSALSLTYTLPDNYTNASDILAATHRRLCDENESSSSEPVSFRFFHIMSRINFQLTNDAAADIVTVNEIKLEGVNRTGSFTITPSPLSPGSHQTSDSDFSESSWTDIKNIGTVTAAINVDVPENEERSLFPVGNALFMIPQPDNNDVIMHITYTLHDHDGNGMQEDKQMTLTAETPIGGWKPGKVYTYSLALKEISKEIELTVKVNDWQTPSPTSILIPES